MTDAERLADLILTDWLLNPLPPFDREAWKKRKVAKALEEAA